MERQVGEQGLVPVQLHSVTDRKGRSSVALTPLYALPEYEKEGEILVDRCERLYQSFLTVGGKPQWVVVFLNLDLAIYTDGIRS